MTVQEERSRLLGEEPIPRLLLKFSMPAIVGMLVTALYNIVDRIFLGQVSNEAIAAVYVTFPIALIIMAVDMGIGIGGASLASIRLGQKRHSEAERILGNAFTMLVVFSLLTAVLMFIYLVPLLRLFGCSETLLPLAVDYQRIIIYGIPVQMLGFGLNNFIRSEGSPRTAMVTMLIGAVLNTIFDYFFIIRWGWGVEGAAWATILSQGVSFVWVMWYFLSSRSMLSLRVGGLIPDGYVMRQILALGLPSFGMQLAASLVMTVFNHELKFWGGDLAVAAMGVVQSVSTLCFLPVFGINQGVQPIIGFNYGARAYQRVKDALRIGILAGTVYLVLTFAIIELFPDAILRVFVSDPAAYASIHPMAHEGLRLYFITLPILAYPIIGSIYFQATGKPAIAIFLSLSRQLLILIPLLYGMARLWGMTGIWLAYPASDIISTVIVAFFLVRAMRELNETMDEEAAKKSSS